MFHKVLKPYGLHKQSKVAEATSNSYRTRQTQDMDKSLGEQKKQYIF